MIILVAKSQVLLILMWSIAPIHNWMEMLNVREKIKDVIFVSPSKFTDTLGPGCHPWTPGKEPLT